MAENGMTPVQALMAATIVSAKILRQENLLGVVRKGALADLIAVMGNPLQNIEVIRQTGFVMKNGNIYKKPQ